MFTHCEGAQKGHKGEQKHITYNTFCATSKSCLFSEQTIIYDGMREPELIIIFHWQAWVLTDKWQKFQLTTNKKYNWVKYK